MVKVNKDMDFVFRAWKMAYVIGKIHMFSMESFFWGVGGWGDGDGGGRDARNLETKTGKWKNCRFSVFNY